jgi:hypothetical protein
MGTTTPGERETTSERKCGARVLINSKPAEDWRWGLGSNGNDSGGGGGR